MITNQIAGLSIQSDKTVSDNQDDSAAEIHEADQISNDSRAVLLKWRIQLALLVWSAMFGAYSTYGINQTNGKLGDPRIGDFLLSIPAIALLVSWCRTDSKQHGYRMGAVTVVLLVLLFYLWLPFYFLRTRGLRGFWSIAKTVGFVLLMLAAWYFGCMVMFDSY